MADINFMMAQLVNGELDPGTTQTLLQFTFGVTLFGLLVIEAISQPDLEPGPYDPPDADTIRKALRQLMRTHGGAPGNIVAQSLQPGSLHALTLKFAQALSAHTESRPAATRKVARKGARSVPVKAAKKVASRPKAKSAAKRVVKKPAAKTPPKATHKVTKSAVKTGSKKPVPRKK